MSTTHPAQISEVTGGVTRTLADKLGEIVSVRDYGAKGDGTTDDTAAIQAALNAANVVHGSPGDNYLTNGALTASMAGQVIDFSGCTLTLKSGATSHGMLALSGAGAKVIGGTWDLNVAGNATGDPYGYYAVILNADRTVAEGMYVLNSFGIGIKGSAAKNYLEARFNRVENAAFIGILFDGSATGTVGNSIHHNKVDVSGNLSALGIYIASASPYSAVHQRWRIQDNEVVGPLASATGASVGITGRGLDGIVSGNHVIGFDLGISIDISGSARTLIENNRIEGTNGPDGFGIEINGERNIVSGNYIKGGKRGITGSSTGSPSTSMDGSVIVGNELEEQTVNAIYFQPGVGNHANRLDISHNIIVSTATAQNGAIRFLGDCRYSKIQGNVIRGPGSGSTGGRAIFFDAVNSDQFITGNRFAGWERPVALYNAGAVAQTNIEFIGNDLTEDMTSTNNWLNLEGLATYGTGIVQAWNTGQQGTAVAAGTNYLDRANATMFQWSNVFTTPEANVTAGVGSLYVKTVTGGGPVALWQKVSGTGNTGWRPIYVAGRSAPTFGATVSIDASAGDFFDVLANAATVFTVSNPTNAINGAKITVRIANTSGGALGAVTWSALYKLAAWTHPATGFSRSITFRFDGTNWIEISRTPVDVPN